MVGWKKIKKKNNFFKRTFSLAVFLFPVIKKGKKVSGFVFFRKGRGKIRNRFKKKKIFFSPLGRFLTIFGGSFAAKDD